MKQDIDMSQYEVVYFNCEGTNEYELLKWIVDEDRLTIPEDVYSLRYARVHSKNGRKDMCNKILELDYDGKVGIVYIHDSLKEKWKLPKQMQNIFRQRQIEWLPLTTVPEIEILLVNSDSEALQEWMKYKSKYRANCKVCDFCNSYYGVDIKKSGQFVSKFSSFEAMVEGCRKYKSEHRKQFTFADLIKLIK